MMNRNNQNAYLTVYLSLMFGVVLSLLLALIEGAAVGAARLQSQIVADLALDSVFAEYHRELLDQYNLFFIDTSYGTVNSGIGMVESHLTDYISYNIDPNKDKLLNSIFKTSYLSLDNPQHEILSISYATDDNADVWKTAAVNYTLGILSPDTFSYIEDYIVEINDKGYETKDTIDELKQMKQKADDKIEEEMVEKYGEVVDKGYVYEKASNKFDDIVGGAFLEMAIPSDDKISDAQVTGGPYYSYRLKNGNINKGAGLHEGVDSKSGSIYELAYNLYLSKSCGSFTNPKEKGLLKYQQEYILYGCSSDKDNMKKVVERIYALRLASNTACIYNDAEIKSATETALLIIFTAMGIPEATETATDFVLAVMAAVESASDVKILLNGGRVPLTKSSGQWNISISGLINGLIFGTSKDTQGLTYDEYLLIFLGMMNSDTKLARSLDIVEMDIRQTKGNGSFCIDRCADYINVQFGFCDGYGHNFLFTRSYCYD